MMESDFHRFIGAEAVGSSGHHSDFVVETLNGSRRNLPLGSEPVQQEVFMGPQHPSHFLHRPQAAAHRPPGPVVEKGSGPGGGAVLPEMREDLLQRRGPSRLELAGQQGVQPLPRPPTHPAATTQQGPAGVLELLGGRLACRSQTYRLGPPHLVHRLVQVHRDVEAVQDVQRFVGLRCDDVEVWFPHVATDKAQTLHRLRPQRLQP